MFNVVHANEHKQQHIQQQFKYFLDNIVVMEKLDSSSVEC